MARANASSMSSPTSVSMITGSGMALAATACCVTVSATAKSRPASFPAIPRTLELHTHLAADNARIIDHARRVIEVDAADHPDLVRAVAAERCHFVLVPDGAP